MKREKIILYILQLFLLLVLILSLSISSLLNSRIELAIFLIIYALIVKFLIKKKLIPDINKKKVTIMLIVTGFLYIGLFYTFGIYSGFYKSINKFGLNTIINYILPITAIIISGEYIRNKFIGVETKVSKVLNFLIGVLIDISIYSSLYHFESLDDFLLSLGYLVFAAIASNLLYNYISKRYGVKPVIYYRLITILYTYIIPIVPDVYIFFSSFIRMLYPLIVYYIIEDYYQKDKRDRISKRSIKTNIISIISFILMVLFIMLISCKFRFGILVIGSNSMNPEIEKGDVILIDAKDVNDLSVGDVIAFNSGEIIIIHRIKEIAIVNNEKVYYTKGDNNEVEDTGYRKKDDIVGKVKLVIPDIGKPTIYIHDTFNKNERGEI